VADYAFYDEKYYASLPHPADRLQAVADQIKGLRNLPKFRGASDHGLTVLERRAADLRKRAAIFMDSDASNRECLAVLLAIGKLEGDLAEWQQAQYDRDRTADAAVSPRMRELAKLSGRSKRGSVAVRNKPIRDRVDVLRAENPVQNSDDIVAVIAGQSDLNGEALDRERDRIRKVVHRYLRSLAT
jgi:hypothetical protein